MTWRMNMAEKVSSSASRLSPVFKNGYVDIELFAGAGGLSLGLAAAGLAPDHLYELDKHCCSTLRHNTQSPNPLIVGEIHQCSINGLRCEYRCECGFNCTGRGDIWDHAQECGRETRRQYIQTELPL